MRTKPVMGHHSSGVVAATGWMSWSGCVGAMYRLLTTSMSASVDVRQVRPAHEQGASQLRCARARSRRSKPHGGRRCRRRHRHRHDHGHHHQGGGADRHRHAGGSVLCGTHRRSFVLAKRCPPRPVSVSRWNLHSRAGATSSVVHHCNLACLRAGLPGPRSSSPRARRDGDHPERGRCGGRRWAEAMP